MRQQRLACAVAAAILAWGSAVASEESASPPLPPDSDINTLRTDFEYGKYAEVLQRAQSRLDRGSLTEEQVTEVHRYAGLAAFNLNRFPEAQRHLAALLRIDPDFSLDPFVNPPPVINYLEKLRKNLAAELDAIRQERRLEAVRKQRAEEDRAQLRREAEEQRKRIEDLSRKVTVHTVEKRSFLVNFVPFGAGQFQENRPGLGLLLAAVEGAVAATSVIAYFADYSLTQCQVITLDGRQTSNGTVSITVCGVPANEATTSQVWRNLKIASGGLFYALYAFGIVDAIYHHEDQIDTTRVIDLPNTPPAGQPPPRSAELDRALIRRKPPPVAPFIIPLPGGIGAGVSIRF